MKRLLTVIILLFGAFTLNAQKTQGEPASSTFGLDSKDAVAVRQIRYRMAQIRRTRPTVALVLSGGGAKGAATVGVLKYLEENYQMPIDMVVGTSIGGLLGGFYALGYDAAALDTLIHNIDWDMALSDKVDRKYIPYSRTRYKEKFFLSFPFYYKAEDYKAYLRGDMPFTSGRNRQLRIGADTGSDEESVSDLVRGNLLGSLPSGFVFGQNVNHIISSRTVGYSDSTDFFKFPIPFACVATDMASGKAKVWHDGSINLAMRSTMSIPGLFAPVRTGGMVLVDGGMRNNFPVNIAREMGADIIIGVDLSNDSLKADDIQNLADILISSIDLFSNDAFEKNIESVDVRIHPNMDGYNMLSFNNTAIDSMLVRGYNAAAEHSKELDAIRHRVGKAKRKLNSTPAVDIGQTPVVINAIDIVGVSETEADYIRSKMYVKPGSIVNRRIIEEDIAGIFGQGAYDYVNYEFRGTSEPYRLRITCKRGPMNQLGMGARIDTEELAAVLLNVGINTNSMSGSSLDMTARISGNPYIDLQYSYNAPKFSTVNLRAITRYTDRNTFFSGTNRYSIRFLTAAQELYMSNMRWINLDVKLGIRNQYAHVFNVLTSDDVVGDYDISSSTRDYLGAFLEGRVETLDNGYFPSKGVSAGIRLDAISRYFDPTASQKWMGVIAADGTMPVSLGRFSLVPSASLRFILGEDIPIIYSNVMGGDIRGRYVEQQLPFVGISNAAFRRNFLALMRLDARYRIGKNHYLSLMGNVSYDWDHFVNFESGESVWGVGLGYGYNTIAGPIKAQVYWSSLTNRLGAYLSFGYNF